MKSNALSTPTNWLLLKSQRGAIGIPWKQTAYIRKNTRASSHYKYICMNATNMKNYNMTNPLQILIETFFENL